MTEIDKLLLTAEEEDLCTPTPKEIEAYLLEPDDTVAKALTPQEKRLVATGILYGKKIKQAQLAKATPIIVKRQQEKDTAYYAEMMKKAIDRVKTEAKKQERAKWIPTNLVIVGVAYRFYPGGVECIITDQDEAGFNETKGFAKADTLEFYDRHELASKALLQALKEE